MGVGVAGGRLQRCGPSRVSSSSRHVTGPGRLTSDPSATVLDRGGTARHAAGRRRIVYRLTTDMTVLRLLLRVWYQLLSVFIRACADL
jgi:hypothetical protein